jgi:hypothetical protein
VNEAQQDVMRLVQNRSRKSSIPPRWQAEASLMAIVSACGLGLIVTLASLAQAPTVDRQQIVFADQLTNPLSRKN